MKLSIAARASPLSQAQAQEVLLLLKEHWQEVEFDLHLVQTTGDQDKKTSLRTLDKTDFFTKEVDELVLSDQCQFAIHSAKDLPAQLPNGLQLIALTHGQTAADALVMKEGETLHSLPKGARIAASSFRREQCIQKLRPDFTFVDVRGTIEERLAKMQTGEVDGVVVAEAAIVRLRLSHLNRILLSDETTPYQGQLAIVGKKDCFLFHPLDSRNVPYRTAYVGIDAPENKDWIHFPLIQVIPSPKETVAPSFEKLPLYTHLIFTSKNGVRLFLKNLTEFGFTQKNLMHVHILAVGKKTAQLIENEGFNNKLTIAEDECAEGLIEVIESLQLTNGHFFWPHSVLARNVISNYFKTRTHFLFEECNLYTTRPLEIKDPFPLAKIHEIVFTSPSTVDAYIHLFGKLPWHKRLTAIGSVTHFYLKK